MKYASMYVALNSKLNPAWLLEMDDGTKYPSLRRHPHLCDKDIAKNLITQLATVLAGDGSLAHVANDFAETTVIDVRVYETGHVVDFESATLVGFVPVSLALSIISISPQVDP